MSTKEWDPEEWTEFAGSSDQAGINEFIDYLQDIQGMLPPGVNPRIAFIASGESEVIRKVVYDRYATQAAPEGSPDGMIFLACE